MGIAIAGVEVVLFRKVEIPERIGERPLERVYAVIEGSVCAGRRAVYV